MGERPFAVIRRLVDDIVTVTDAELLDALALCWSRTKQLVEPTAALPLAALRTGAASGDRVGVVLTGGNVDAAALAACLRRSRPPVILESPGVEEAACRRRPGSGTTAWPRDGRWTRRGRRLPAPVPGAGPARLRGRRPPRPRPARWRLRRPVGLPDPDAEEAAGWPVFGQFVAHDITADRSPLTHHAELVEVRNAPQRANLETVYGDGPAGMPFLPPATTRPSCWSAATTPADRPTCPATPRASPSSATPATTSTC